MCWRYKRYICLDTDTDTATVVGIGSVLKDIVQKLISGMYLLSQILPTRKCFVRYFPVSGGTASELFSVWLTSPPPAFESPQIWLTSCPVWAVLCPFQLVIPPPFFFVFLFAKVPSCYFPLAQPELQVQVHSGERLRRLESMAKFKFKFILSWPDLAPSPLVETPLLGRHFAPSHSCLLFA